jgi:hypothetical protein
VYQVSSGSFAGEFGASLNAWNDVVVIIINNSIQVLKLLLVELLILNIIKS